MLMLVAVELGALWRFARTRRPWTVSLALVVICIGHVLILAMRHGPFW